ncbi:MAG: hypothetical protein KA963_02345 [Candidatus Cloacimonas sp.]|nr:hypothetical protein [Candidatus Cloacimonas sp.]
MPFIFGQPSGKQLYFNIFRHPSPPLCDELATLYTRFTSKKIAINVAIYLRF